MIDETTLQRVLAVAASGGADFAEVFAEDKRSSSAVLDDGKVEELTSGRDRGAGIRVVVGESTGFAHTADLSEASLLETAEPPVASVPMKLPATVLFTTPEPVSQMPAPWFPETTLPGPIVLNEDASVMITPPRPFGSAASPAARVPTREPVTLLSWVAAPEIHTPYSVFPDRTLPGPMVLSCAPSEICTPCCAFGAALVPSLPTPHQQSRTVLPEAFGWSMAMPTHGERTMPSPRTVQPDA